MYELRSLWLSTFRSIAVLAFVMLLAAASTAPALAQLSGGPHAGVSSSDPGIVVTDADGEEEDIDEWENDILKSTAPPPVDGWLHRVLAPWIDAVGAFLGVTADAETASK